VLLVPQAIVETADHRHGAQHPSKVVEIKSTLVTEPNFIGFG
jgi:hypothetical protein